MIGGWKYASEKRGRIMEMGKSTISLVFSIKVDQQHNNYVSNASKFYFTV